MAAFFLISFTIGSEIYGTSLFKLSWSCLSSFTYCILLISPGIASSLSWLNYLSGLWWILFKCFRSASLEQWPTPQSGHLKVSIALLAASLSSAECFVLWSLSYWAFTNDSLHTLHLNYPASFAAVSFSFRDNQSAGCFSRICLFKFFYNVKDLWHSLHWKSFSGWSESSLSRA